jgi:DNA polymerase-1
LPLITAEIDGEAVKVFALPPSDPERRAHFGGRWRQFCESETIFGLDVETTAIDEDLGAWHPDAKLRAVQFGTATQAWMLDPTDPFWRRRIVGLLNDPCKRFVSHTNYDVLWILREFGIDLGVDDRSLDTFPMAALLRPGETNAKDLKTLSTIFIDWQLVAAEKEMHARFYELAPKEARKGTTTKNGLKPGKALKAWGFTNIPLDDPSFSRYGGFDAIYVRRLLDILNARLRAAGMARLGRREQRIERLMTAVQVRGHKLDAEYTLERLNEINATFEAADNYVQRVCDCKSGSPKVGLWLEGNGVSFVERTPTGRPKLASEQLEYLVELYEPGTPAGDVLAALLTLSTHKNMRSNLAQCYRAQDRNGFVHPRILTQQAYTGRMSMRNPPMQTFKKGPLRGCFVVSAPGNVFVGADYEGQEIRIAAAFSDDPLLWQIVLEGLSQHVLTAERIFPDFAGKEESPDQYKAAKILDFAQQYMAGPKKIAAQLGKPYAEGKALWAAWRKTYAGLVRWSEHVARFDSITNPWGRLIPQNPFKPYANGNYAIQSSGRDALGDALVNLDARGYGRNIWLPVHDEIILEVPESDAEHACRVLEECMYTKIGDMELTAKAEIIGTRWSGEK